MSPEKDFSEVKSLVCPNCGAALDEHLLVEGTARCSFCGSLLQLPSVESSDMPGKDEVIIISLPQQSNEQAKKVVAMAAASAASATVAGGLIAWVIGLVIVVSVCLPLSLAIVPPLLSMPAFSSAFKTIPLSWGFDGIHNVAVAPLSENATPDLLLTMRDQNSEKYAVVALNGADGKFLWRSPALTKDSYRIFSMPTDQQIFLADESSLLALNRVDGKLQWQTPLDFPPSNQCPACWMATEEKVLLMQNDGSIHAYNTDDGSSAWMLTLNNQYMPLYRVGEQAGVIDREEEDLHRLFFVLLNPQTGNEVYRLIPGFPAELPQDNPQDLLLTPDGARLIAFYSYLDSRYLTDDGSSHSGQVHGLQVWNASNGKLISEQTLESDTWSNSWSTTDLVIDGDRLFYADMPDETIYFLDLSSGSLKPVFREKNYRARPLGVQGNYLVAWLVHETDYNRIELRGVDLTSGETIWSYKFAADNGDNSLDAHLLDSSVATAQCLEVKEDQYECRWEKIDLASGKTSAALLLPSSNEYLQVTWTPTAAYLNSMPKMWVIDMVTDKLLYTKP